LFYVIVLISFLKPATSYALRVQGFTSPDKVGPFSQPINVTTSSDRKLWFMALCSFRINPLKPTVAIWVQLYKASCARPG